MARPDPQSSIVRIDSQAGKYLRSVPFTTRRHAGGHLPKPDDYPRNCGGGVSPVIVSKPDLEWCSLRERVSFFVGAFGEHLITCEGCAAWPSQTLVRHLTRRLQ